MHKGAKQQGLILAMVIRRLAFGLKLRHLFSLTIPHNTSQYLIQPDFYNAPPQGVTYAIGFLPQWLGCMWRPCWWKLMLYLVTLVLETHWPWMVPRHHLVPQNISLAGNLIFHFLYWKIWYTCKAGRRMRLVLCWYHLLLGIVEDKIEFKRSCPGSI